MWLVKDLIYRTPYQLPPPSSLPTFCVMEALVFTYTRNDFPGPLNTKDIENCKVWICLYTCCIIRSVHLKIVPNLTAQGFLQTLISFLQDGLRQC